ncbi:MAG TPA: threonine synthase [Candidatus Polarisedimenticolia bacterium]|nr:threonine synthase [Candidatus Polarisedimenticolia bacterium]
MRYISTSGRAPAVTLKTALLDGLAPDGGLYMPEMLPRAGAELLASLRGAPFEKTAAAFAGLLLGDEIPGPILGGLISSALDFPVPLVRVTKSIHILELFHGPTCAFKDVGARVLARLLSHLAGDERRITVLVATSGDTGGAVASAFFGLPAARVVILYPRGQISRLQEAQIATLGGNVEAVSVAGTFDDCQRMVKEAFADGEVRRRLTLTSANSINVGRLLPQTFYYFHAAGLLASGDQPLIFSTPSGNFGNLTAGLMAKRMGLPAERFVAATNVNDVVPSYLATGLYAPRPSIRTISNAMDVGAPSNFARMLALYDGDVAAMRRDVIGSRQADEATRDCIRRVFEQHGRVLDPHTAVGYLGLEEALEAGAAPAMGIVLATAHPAKFPEVIEPILGRPPELPETLKKCLDRPVLSREMPPSLAPLRDLLLEGA